MGHKKTPEAGWRGCSVSLAIANMKLKSPTLRRFTPPFPPPQTLLCYRPPTYNLWHRDFEMLLSDGARTVALTFSLKRILPIQQYYNKGCVTIWACHLH
jgi:hypothetical protein